MRIGGLFAGRPENDGEVVELKSFDNTTVTELVLSDPDVITWRMQRAESHRLLSQISFSDLCAIFEKAGRIFCEDAVDVGNQRLNPQEFSVLVSQLTGAPISGALRTLNRVRDHFSNIAEIIKYQVPMGQLSVLDDGYYRVNGKNIAWIPKGNNLFVSAPSNHPSVHLLWILGVALGFNPIVRPSVDDPVTPLRLLQSLIDAGLPAQSVSYLPSQHSAVSILQKHSDCSLLFGGEALEKKYANSSNTRVFGPGRSVMIVGEDYKDQMETVVDLAVESMTRDGGRGCINLSCIIAQGNGREIADLIAQRVARIPVVHPLEDTAILGAIKHENSAIAINQTLESHLASGDEDVTAHYRDGDRLHYVYNTQFLQATVVYCQSKNGLFGKEFGFPFITVIDIQQEDSIVCACDQALTVTLLSESQTLLNKLLFSPSIGKVYQGNHLTCDINYREPHDGYLSELLFTSKAYREL